MATDRPPVGANASLLLRLLLFAACLPSAQAGNLCVTTRDPAGQSLPGVSVTIAKRTDEAASLPFAPTQTRTDAAGQACFFQIPDGSYSVELALHGFLTATYQPIRVDVLRPASLAVGMLFGQVIELDISRIARITGVIRFRDEPAAEARICVYEGDSRHPANCSRPDRFGQFGLLVEPGAYVLEVTRQDKVYLRKSVNIPSAGTFLDLIPPLLPEER